MKPESTKGKLRIHRIESIERRYATLLRLVIIGVVSVLLPLPVFATLTTFNFSASDNSGNSLTGTIQTDGSLGNLSAYTNPSGPGALTSFDLTGTGPMFGGDSPTTFAGTSSNVDSNNGLDALCALAGPTIGYCSFPSTTAIYSTQFFDASSINPKEITIGYVSYSGNYYWDYSNYNSDTSGYNFYYKLNITATPQGGSVSSVSSVPEPPQWALLGLGLLLLGGLYRRMRNQTTMLTSI